MEPEATNLLNELLQTLASGELRVTVAVCAVSLVAVWVPLSMGGALCWRARRATRRDPADALLEGSVEGVARRVLDGARRDADAATDLAFVRDAARQLVTDDYETHFIQPISMYANLLPPIGFIGTTCGLAVLLISMRVSNDALQMGALALALSSTIFALVGYALLEGTKIHLHGRLVRSIEDGLRQNADG